MRPLAGFRVGVTAARKGEEQVLMLERRGADVVLAPALSAAPHRVDDVALRAATEDVLARPVDLFLATTGIGMRTWFAAADEWGLGDRLVSVLGDAEILARGPKTVGALRGRGLRERWAAASEELGEMVEHLDKVDLRGRRVVVQEHGQSLSTLAETLRARGADVATVAIYRVAPAEDRGPLAGLIANVAEGEVDAVTFTSAPAVAALLEVAAEIGCRDAVLEAFRGPVLAVSVGPVTAAAFDVWDVPTVYPERSRLGAMVKLVETELPARAGRPS